MQPELSGYDFEDPLIRDMVRENHTPTEHVLTSSQSTLIMGVECERCRNPWPCPQITAYREWEAALPQSIMTNPSSSE